MLQNRSAWLRQTNDDDHASRAAAQPGADAGGGVSRGFTHRQRRHLYIVAEGKCESCGRLLDEHWEAHHRTRYADGGATEIVNAQALCRRCHRLFFHGRPKMRKPRRWQVDAINKLKTHTLPHFLLEVTPGGGKTAFAAQADKHWHDIDVCDFTIIVVPTTVIKGDASGGFLYEFHLEGIAIATRLRDERAPPSNFLGAVVTYSQLPNLIATLQTWQRNGCRLHLIFDEIHHATEENKWGNAAEDAARCAVKVLSMTGTPFRSDGYRISFVKYDVDGIAVADHRYSYRQAVTDHVCRPVEFITDDGIASYIHDEEQQSVRISEVDDQQAPKAAAALFSRSSEFLEKVILSANGKLDEYRISDVDAAALVVCRPGMDDNDDKHLRIVAKLTGDTIGEWPEVITHDDPEANVKIERFRQSHQRFICAVRKISEGVDIKRTRIIVVANLISTELLFRQIVGRALRVDNPDRVDWATVYIPKFPHLQAWAKRISDDVEAGLREMPPVDGKPRDARTPSGFVPLGGTYEAGGAISDFGEEFTAAEINAIERDKRDDPQLFGVAVTTLAYLRRKWDVASPDFEEPATEPLEVQKKRLRKLISNLVRQSVFRHKQAPTNDDFKAAFIVLLRPFGAKNLNDLVDNYSLDVMRQVYERAKAM
jgi:superfamily II DNA or RNA helicase